MEAHIMTKQELSDLVKSLNANVEEKLGAIYVDSAVTDVCRDAYSEAMARYKQEVKELYIEIMLEKLRGDGGADMFKKVLDK